jgi:hypothetical protein
MTTRLNIIFVFVIADRDFEVVREKDRHRHHQNIWQGMA